MQAINSKRALIKGELLRKRQHDSNELYWHRRYKRDPKFHFLRTKESIDCPDGN